MSQQRQILMLHINQSEAKKCCYLKLDHIYDFLFKNSNSEIVRRLDETILQSLAEPET